MKMKMNQQRSNSPNKKLRVVVILFSVLFLVGCISAVFFYPQLQKRFINLQKSIGLVTSGKKPVVKDTAVDTKKNVDSETGSQEKILDDAKTEDPKPTVKTGACYWPTASLTPKSGNDLSVVVNKSFCLPSSYAPGDLVDISATGIRKTKSSHLVRQVIVADLKAMVSAIKAAGLDISALSCYRSYSVQVTVYNRNVKTYGQTYADTISARPGHSEHQLGTTCDFGTSETGDELGSSFGGTKVFTWLVANAGSYGFKLSYPKGNPDYSYEPWHWRYGGK